MCRVLKTFRAMRGAFEEGEILVFEKDAWSRCDGMTGYFFHDASGIGRAGDVRDEDDVDRWRSLYVEVREDSASNASWQSRSALAAQKI